MRKPPKELSRWDPLIATLPQDSLWYRSYSLTNSPHYFGRNKNQRWDAPSAEYGVLYLAEDPEGAFMESIGRGVLRTKLVPQAALETRGIAVFSLVRELRVIDLASTSGLTRVGAEGSISNGLGYKTAQAWSRAFHEHPTTVDGILYRSRHDPARKAVALFDRCEDGVRLASAGQSWMGQPMLLGRILDLYGFGIGF